MTYYSNSAFASMHPFTVAYQKFEADKQDALTQMKTNKICHDLYVQQEERLNRLINEQKQLLKIMDSDLTGDLLVAKLQG